jgi:hypothetical protein
MFYVFARVCIGGGRAVYGHDDLLQQIGCDDLWRIPAAGACMPQLEFTSSRSSVERFDGSAALLPQ